MPIVASEDLASMMPVYQRRSLPNDFESGSVLHFLILESECKPVWRGPLKLCTLVERNLYTYLSPILHVPGDTIPVPTFVTPSSFEVMQCRTVGLDQSTAV